MPQRSRLGLALSALLLWGLQGSAGSHPLPGFIASFFWDDEAEAFGGYSAIELTADGLGLVALTDRGAFVKGRLTRDAAGRITGVEAGPVTRLLADGPAPLRKWRADSEGLALAPDGSFFVSFENAARVLHYPQMGAEAENLPIPDAFRNFPRNAGLEALAVDASGTLYTLPERTGTRGDRSLLGDGGNDDEGPFPVFRYRGGVWDQPFALPRGGAMVPAGADIGPDGRLYIIERQFHGFAGFSSRLRRFVLSETGLMEEEVLMTSPSGLHDNLEGISVWRDAEGALRATMIADDNFNPLQRTEIVEYRLPD